jgi:hypothetical protein
MPACCAHLRELAESVRRPCTIFPLPLSRALACKGESGDGSALSLRLMALSEASDLSSCSFALSSALPPTTAGGVYPAAAAGATSFCPGLRSAAQ